MFVACTCLAFPLVVVKGTEIHRKGRGGALYVQYGGGCIVY